jgi:hypothetical protein
MPWASQVWRVSDDIPACHTSVLLVLSQEPLWRLQQGRQHLFGGEQGAEEDDDGDGAADALPPPPANPQVSIACAHPVGLTVSEATHLFGFPCDPLQAGTPLWQGGQWS